MQKYKPKTPVAGCADKMLRMVVTSALGVGWFVWLWGLSLPSLAAGFALGGLLWLCVRLFGKQSTERREKQMRRIIGGELALNDLLLMPPRHAAFQAALWIAPRVPVCMQRAVDWGVIGTLEGQTVLIRLIAQHESVKVNVQQVIKALRDMRTYGAARCVLCLTAPAAREAVDYAAQQTPPVRIIAREEMIDLAGLCSPATDEDLSRLARKKKTRRTAKEWISIALDASRSKRYFWYGVGLSALTLLTGQMYYPLPAALCLGLWAASKARALHRSRHA